MRLLNGVPVSIDFTLPLTKEEFEATIASNLKVSLASVNELDEVISYTVGFAYPVNYYSTEEYRNLELNKLIQEDH